MAIYMVAMVVIGIVLRGQATKSIADFGLAANRFGSTVIAAVSIGAWVGSAGLIGLCASSYTGAWSAGGATPASTSSPCPGSIFLPAV